MTPVEANLQIMAAILGSEPTEETVRIAVDLARDAVSLADGAVWLGDGQIAVGGETLKLSGRRAVVIETLVRLRAAEKPELERESKCADATQLFREVRKLFPQLRPYLIPAGARGRGGYRTTIVDRR